MPEIPQFIKARARANSGLFTADEVAAWPAGLFEELTCAGVLLPAKPANTIACDACDDDHIENVQFIRAPLDTELRAYIRCPQNGRVRVLSSRLLQWKINMKALTVEPFMIAPKLPPAQLPLALSLAHARLIGALVQAEDLYQRTLRFPNSLPVIDAIEAFVHELAIVPHWLEELQRRTSIVEERCSKDSVFDQLRSAALDSHTIRPTELCRAGLALDYLRRDHTVGCLFVSNVIDIRKEIESLIAASDSGLSTVSISAFALWRDECRNIQLNAERLHVDGCWYLNYVFHSFCPAPTERAKAAKAILQCDMGGTHLFDIRHATDSIAAWAGEAVNTQTIDDPLSDRARAVLVAMLELRTFDADCLRSTDDIAAKAFGKGTDANSLKSVMADLNTREMISSRTGRGGGCWLTAKGRARAEKLHKSLK